MLKMLLTLGGVVLLLAILVFFIVLFIALKNHYGWGEDKQEHINKHWQDKYYSSKKEGL